MQGKTPVALVLDGGGAQAVVLVRALGMLDWDVVTESRTRAARSRWTTGTVELPSPYVDPDVYADRLQEVCERLNVDLVAPSSDLTLARCWQAAGEDGTIAGARVLAAGRAAADVFLDKLAGVETARRHGFGVPKTFAGASARDVLDAVGELGFPCVVKPRRSFQRVSGVMRQLRHVVVGGREEAEAAVVALTGDDGLLPLAQEFVVGPPLAVTGVLRKGVVVAFSARETFSFFPLAGGTSVWKRTIPPTTPGVQEALAFLSEFGLHGIAELEYKLSADGPRFMELGPRIHAWIPLAEASSPGLLAAAIETVLGRDVQPLDHYRADVEMRWIGGELQRLRSILRPRTALPPATSRLTEIRAIWPPWRPAMRYDGIDLRDPGPWVPGLVGRALESALQRSSLRRWSVTRGAEKDAPLTNRQSGPNVPSAG